MAQELCASRGGRPGLLPPNKPTVSVDIKHHFNNTVGKLTDAGGDAGAALGARDDGQLRQGVDGGAGHTVGQGARVLPALVQQQVEDGAVVVVAVGLHRLQQKQPGSVTITVMQGVVVVKAPDLDSGQDDQGRDRAL